MMLNAKLNDTAKKFQWSEAAHTCERVRKFMAATGSTTSPFVNFYVENRRLLVCSQSLDVLATSINGTSSRRKLQTIFFKEVIV